MSRRHVAAGEAVALSIEPRQLARLEKDTNFPHAVYRFSIDDLESIDGEYPAKWPPFRSAPGGLAAPFHMVSSFTA